MLTILLLRRGRRRFRRGHPGALFAALAATAAAVVVDLVHHVVVRSLGLVPIRVRVATTEYRGGDSL